MVQCLLFWERGAPLSTNLFLFLFDGITSSIPVVPASLKDGNISKTGLHKFSRHTDAGPLIGSGTIDNKLLLFG